VRARGRQIDAVVFEQPAQLVDVMGSLLRQAESGHHCLQPLLDRLLGVEADISSLISELPANSRAAVASFLALRE